MIDMANRSSCKRTFVEFLDGNDDDAEQVYRFQILLPDGTNTRLTLHDPGEEMFIDEFIYALRKEVEKSGKSSHGVRKILWNGDIYLEDMHDHKIKKKIFFNHFKAKKCHILKLHDGAGPSVDTFHNMWDLTPDTDLLQELPAEYTFETALADLIDNSLQAVWSNAPGERRMIRVTSEEQKVVIFDSGPGMDGSHENSISKWGKMGSSNHRSSRQMAVGGKAPYLMPFFGMFGYGGPIASMHLGRNAIVSSKTKESKKVYTLYLSREALIKKSSDKFIWRADGGIRNPLDEELLLSPHGSFTKVEICDLKLRRMEIFKLQCFLKDIYFPYIQCDEGLLSKRTMTPIKFQVNDTDLAEIEGGETAVTNLHSCNGPDFVLQLHLIANDGDQTSKTPGSRTCRQANARLKCVYFPIVEGKENVDRILEKLEVDGLPKKEGYEKFSHVSIRRLGRLLPDARWSALPFMEPHKKRGDKAQLLRRCCHRVKCFIDTDAGFSPTPSKTNLAHHDPFTLALRGFGSKPSGDESVATTVEIHKDGKPLNLSQLEKEYSDWIVQMHDAYDEEVECGEDEPVLVIAPFDKKKLMISADVIRIHKVIRRKGLLWKSGQKVKILKGAVGCSKNNLYATLEYFLLEGFQGDVGGEARLICRLLGCPDERGCLLKVNDVAASLDIRDSQSFPISEIDNGKIQPVDDTAWNYQLGKKMEKAPSRIDILTSEQCSLLNIQGELPLKSPVLAGYDPPDEIVAVIRPACYTTSSASKCFDQKYILRDEQEMSMEVRLVSRVKGLKDGDFIFAQRVMASSRNGLHGLYIFSVRHKRAKLFCKAGVYVFSFSLICKDLSCKMRKVSVIVKPASSVGKWSFCDKDGPLIDKSVSVRVGSRLSHLSVASYDQFMNPVPFSSLPEVKLKVGTKDVILAHVDKMKICLSSNLLSIEITDMLFESCYVDMIRPSYEAALWMYSLDGLLLAEVPCRVMPGPLSSIQMQCSSELEKKLSPGTVIEDLKLEMLDAYGNHIQVGAEFPILVDGFSFQDHMGPVRKVDDQGCINLSGLLNVTAGYGSKVRVSVHLDEKMIFEKIFQIVERDLTVVSEVPRYCEAGSELKNVVFGVFDPDGVIDETVHGHQHTLTISSESLGIDNTIQYTFQNGQCIVPYVPVPTEPGTFFFLASHTRYPELHKSIQVHVMQVPKMELIPIENPDLILFQPQCSDNASFPNSSQCSPNQMSLLVETIIDDIRNLDEETQEAALQVQKHEEKLKFLHDQKDRIAEEIRHTKGRMEPQYLTRAEELANSKEQISKRIEGKRNSAAFVFCNLLKAIRIAEPLKHFMQDFVGLVALLGTVSDSRHSSMFSEYLGENFMLAVVCKSHEAASALENYGKNGEVIHNSALHEAAANLGITINSRFPVICLEEIRPFKGAVKRNDPQRKLALPTPLLPSRKIPAGFLGYAVNMIDIDVPHLNTRTVAGYGLRETLFYRLFGETQVYETKQQMRVANACIKHGALSLDGGIMKGNGIIVLGDSEPDIKFPVLPHSQVELPPHAIEILNQLEEKKAHLAATCEEIVKESEAHSKALAKFHKKRDKYKMFLNRKSLSMGNLLVDRSPQGKTG